MFFKFLPARLYSSLVSQKQGPANVDQVATIFASLLQQNIESEIPCNGQTIHSHILKTGYIPNTNILIKILILYLRIGCLRYARQIFDELPRRTLSAYNYLIAGYMRRGMFKESVNLLYGLIRDGERPDGFTFSMTLKVFGSANDQNVPRMVEGAVHAQILKWDTKIDDVLATVLVDSYVKCGSLVYARRVFDSMVHRDVVCSTSMISGYMNQGNVAAAEEIFVSMLEKDTVVYNAMIEGYSKSIENSEKSLEVFCNMQCLGFRPNVSTFSSVIGACSLLAGFELGQQIHCQLLKSAFYSEVKMGSALIDLYSKCGKTNDARRVFDYMQMKNVFSWTSMIDGYGKNGKPNEALQLFKKMVTIGLKPNDVTFLGALSACAHAGMVPEGEEIFDAMKRDYNINPRMDHYACMVDLFGRSGSLQQAWNFIMGMPEAPNADVWAALLSSCNVHGEVDMARIAAMELFKLNATGRPGAYVCLSNTFASAGKWDSVNSLRQMMMSRGVSKEAGSSWSGSGIDGDLSDGSTEP